MIDYVAENGTGNGTVPAGKDIDPTIKEDVPPRIIKIEQSHDIRFAGIFVEYVYLIVKVEATDNVGIEHVYLTFKDTGEKIVAVFNNGKYEGKFSIDFWTDYTWGYEVEVRVFDIAGNEMANTVGGGLQYVVGQLVGSLLSFFLGPTLAGTVMGFFVGFVAGIFEDLSIFLQIGEIFEGLKSIGTLIPTLLENPGMIWEMIKNSLYGIINKAFNFNPFGQGGYTLMQWVENLTALMGDFFDNWNVDDGDLQNFISASANQFNLAFVAAHLVGYIIQQMWVGGFMVLGKIADAAGIAGDLGKIATSLKKAVKSLGKTVKEALSSAKAAAKGILETLVQKARAFIKKLKMSDDAIVGTGKLRAASYKGSNVFEECIGNPKIANELVDEWATTIGKSTDEAMDNQLIGAVKRANHKKPQFARGAQAELDRAGYYLSDTADSPMIEFQAKLDGTLRRPDIKLKDGTLVDVKSLTVEPKGAKYDTFIGQLQDYQKHGKLRVEFEFPMDEQFINKVKVDCPGIEIRNGFTADIT